MYQLVVFTIEDQSYALYLSCVERIIRAVEITLLPKMPEIILGVINVYGQIIPVVDIRKRFSIEKKDLELSHQMIIARTSKRLVALVVDTVNNVIEYSEEQLIESKEILPSMEYVEGIAKIGEKIVLIHDLNKFLSIDEEKLLDEAINR
jgi:purine-binding chemotaxis protein CheW